MQRWRYLIIIFEIKIRIGYVKQAKRWTWNDNNFEEQTALKGICRNQHLTHPNTYQVDG